MILNLQCLDSARASSNAATCSLAGVETTHTYLAASFIRRGFYGTLYKGSQESVFVVFQASAIFPLSLIKAGKESA